MKKKVPEAAVAAPRPDEQQHTASRRKRVTVALFSAKMPRLSPAISSERAGFNRLKKEAATRKVAKNLFKRGKSDKSHEFFEFQTSRNVSVPPGVSLISCAWALVSRTQTTSFSEESATVETRIMLLLPLKPMSCGTESPCIDR